MMTFDVKRIYESALQYVNSPRSAESDTLAVWRLWSNGAVTGADVPHSVEISGAHCILKLTPQDAGIHPAELRRRIAEAIEQAARAR